MRLLVVHDRRDVADEIVALAREESGGRCEPNVAVDMLGARDLLKDHYYDLMIIDLTLPIRKGKGEDTFSNAETLLGEIFEGGALKTPADVLGISKVGDAVGAIKGTIGEHLMGIVTEDAGGKWRDLVRQKLRYVCNARQARQRVSNTSYGSDLVIVTALGKEAAPYDDLFALSRCPDFANAREFLFKSRDEAMRRGILVNVGKSGQAPAASLTQAIITQARRTARFTRPAAISRPHLFGASSRSTMRSMRAFERSPLATQSEISNPSDWASRRRFAQNYPGRSLR